MHGYIDNQFWTEGVGTEYDLDELMAEMEWDQINNTTI